jgi:RHS repeat-associated protein
VTFTLDATGAVSSTAAYDPYGNLVASTGSLPLNRWQSSLIDSASGLYYVIARWYSPTLGRFLSDDALAGQAARPQSLNRYAYGTGDPVDFVDPYGRCSSSDFYSGCQGSAASVADFQAGLPSRSAADAARAAFANGREVATLGRPRLARPWVECRLA